MKQVQSEPGEVLLQGNDLCVQLGSPQRVVGHMHTKNFVRDWGEGENNFAEDPLNAVLSFLEDGDTVPEEVTMVIRDPQVTEDTLTYKVEALDGTLPA